MRGLPMTAIAVCMACLAFSVTAQAGVLGPTRPSQLVSLFSSGNNNCGSYGASLDLREGADATELPFSIPPGQVLVITSAVVNINSPQGPGHSVSFYLRRATTSLSSGSNIVTEFAITDAQNRVDRHFEFPTGVVVKSGVNLCVDAFDYTTSTRAGALAHAQGYLTVDR